MRRTRNTPRRAQIGCRPERVGPDHILQLFDTEESRARAVATFVDTAIDDGHTVLVVATPELWDAVSSSRRSAGGRNRGERLSFLDAEELLGRFMRGGEPSRALFQQTVGQVLERHVASAPVGVRVYGEMVELLARDANYGAAARLEQFWKELATRWPFTLLCGYSAAHFAAPDAGSALGVICSHHTRTLSAHSDLLGEFLLASEGAV